MLEFEVVCDERARESFLNFDQWVEGAKKRNLIFGYTIKGINAENYVTREIKGFWDYKTKTGWLNAV